MGVTLPHVRIGVEPLGDGLVRNAENPVHDVDHAVDGADVLLHDGGVDAAPLHRHQLIPLRVVEPDAIGGERGGGRESLQQFSCELILCWFTYGDEVLIGLIGAIYGSFNRETDPTYLVSSDPDFVVRADDLVSDKVQPEHLGAEVVLDVVQQSHLGSRYAFMVFNLSLEN